MKNSPPGRGLPPARSPLTAPTTSPIQLLAACPNRSYLEAHGFGLEKYLTQPFQLADGFAIAPERPGHGVDFDWPASRRSGSEASFLGGFVDEITPPG